MTIFRSIIFLLILLLLTNYLSGYPAEATSKAQHIDAINLNASAFARRQDLDFVIDDQGSIQTVWVRKPSPAVVDDRSNKHCIYPEETSPE